MRKLHLLFAVALMCSTVVLSQEVEKTSKEDKKDKKDKKIKKDWSKVKLGDRANDHFMFQLGTETMIGLPDSVTKGIGRHLNIYVMLDKPFQTDPRFSVGFGVGIGSSNIYYNNTEVDLKGAVDRTRATLIDVEGKERFNKYKMTTVWAEAPIELRFVANPLNSDKSWKVALGVKIGTMVSGYTKGKDLLSAAGQSIYGNKFIEKEKDRKFLNTTRLAGTLRFGKGNFTIYSAFQITNLYKDGQGPDARPFSLGICLSGL